MATLLVTFLFVVSLIAAVVLLTSYEAKQAEKESLMSQIEIVQEKFSGLIIEINNKLGSKFKLNSEYHKNEILSILQSVDKDLLSTSECTVEFLDRLIANRDLVISKFLSWGMLNSISDEIIKEKEGQYLLQNKLTSEFNSACSKYCHVKAKYKCMVGYLDFVSDRRFYEINYFDKINYLLDLSYKSLEEGNFIKAFNLKQAYDAFSKEAFKLLKAPAEFLQRIHDAKFEIQLMEEDLSNHLVGKRYKRILSKLDTKMVKESTFEKFGKLRVERNNYLTTLKWTDDDIAKHNNLKKIKMMMINLDNQIDMDINEFNDKKKINSRAANILEAESKLNGSFKEIFDDIFDVSY